MSNGTPGEPRGVYWIISPAGIEEQREKQLDETQYTDLIPQIKNTYFEKESVDDYTKKIEKESKYKPRDFWWYFWRVVIVFWVLMFLNVLF